MTLALTLFFAGLFIWWVTGVTNMFGNIGSLGNSEPSLLMYIFIALVFAIFVGIVVGLKSVAMYIINKVRK